MVVIAMVVGSGLALQSPASAEPVVDLAGHGWGHGRGMGQYGALGYALDHGWNHHQILDHYYGGTAGGGIGNIPMSVLLQGLEGHMTIVYQQRGRLRTSADGGRSAHTAILARRVAPGLFDVQYGAGCGGPWTPPTRVVDQQIVVAPEVKGSEDIRDMLELCLPNGTRWYRGDLAVVAADDAQHTVNWLDMESYLRGVVPRESPASWGDLGGGRGMNALRAQAVAARSYAAAESRRPYAKTCDSTSCQVYLGRAHYLNGAFADLEDERSSRAVAETAGLVRFRGGVVARTEFSSSTGGFSAGGVFPPVVDDGDDVSFNPNHRWAARIPFSAIQARYGRGGFQFLEVTRRNGLGDFGGRVLEVRLRFSGGDVYRSGDEFRLEMGLKSNWFAPTILNEIDRHWVALGAERGVLGPAVTDETPTPDGFGRYRHYRSGSIYWTPATGAWAVHGLVRDRWSQLGWERSPVGYPVTDELATPDGVGRYNHFQQGSIYWTPSTNAQEVHGAIRALWAHMGWERSAVGYPTTGEVRAPDGVGRFNHFQGGSIYWTPSTNAHEVHGAIGAKWSRLGSERGLLGYPVTDELRTPNSVGRFNHFQGGSIYWTPSTNAQEVHGAIQAKWSQIGLERSSVGYPVTDEVTTPDGLGRFNHFERGSIYWTPATNAHEVHGPIRDRWAQTGWERGSLGYPTTDVSPTPTGERCEFQGGAIEWNSTTGTTTVMPK
jgi:SpoIID/LytB domain protein